MKPTNHTPVTFVLCGREVGNRVLCTLLILPQLNVNLCRWKEEVQRLKKGSEMDRSLMNGAL